MTSTTITIRLTIQKDIDPATEKNVLRLKGGLIAGGFTDIIHFDDGDDHYINSFSVAAIRKDEVVAHIRKNVEEMALEKFVQLLGH